jgi:rare lipoprotein A (peptidoglycan hydrolase)
MVRFFGIASLALAVVSAVSGRVLRHRKVPVGWETAILEPYDTYHSRYLDLDCYDKHNTTFFDNCCHPLLKDESLSVLDNRQCFSSSTSDCEDGSSSVPQPTSYSPAASDLYTPTSSPPVGPTSSSSLSYIVTPTPVPANYVKPTSAEPTTTAEPTSTPAKASPSPSPANTGSSNYNTGGQGTFFYQNGNAGACGQVHQDTALIVAMDSATFNMSLCGKSVIIINIANGKSVTATVADDCPTCNNANSIDMSVATFTTIAAESVGEIDIKWKYV